MGSLGSDPEFSRASLFERADVAYETSVQKVLRNTMSAHPDMCTVGAPYTELQVEWLTSFESSTDTKRCIG